MTSQRSIRELFSTYVSTLAELRKREVIRSANNPVADYAELLFMRAFNLNPAPGSTKGYDASDEFGRKYEIKGRRPTSDQPSRQLSALRELDKKHFDFLGGVLFAEDFSVLRACLIPHTQVLALSTYTSHTNSWRFLLRDSVWQVDGVIDATEALRGAEAELDTPAAYPTER